jgi:hypothetical protein
MKADDKLSELDEQGYTIVSTDVKDTDRRKLTVILSDSKRYKI